MKLSKILVAGVVFLVFSILSLGIPFNADAALNVNLKLKGPIKLGSTLNSYVLSGPDAEKAMQAINALKRDCCSCSKVGKEIICTSKKGASDCCVKILGALQKTIPIKPTKPSAPTGLSTSGAKPSAPTGLSASGTTPSRLSPAVITPSYPYVTGNVSSPQIYTLPPRLVIRKSGDGMGTVTSSPSGINCGSTCSATYNIPTDVALTATPDPGSSLFKGETWHVHSPLTQQSAIAGNRNEYMDKDQVVEAVFMQLVPVDTSTWICPTGYDCRSGNYQRSYICQYNGYVDCYNDPCIWARDCAETRGKCERWRIVGLDRSADSSTRYMFIYWCEY